MYSYFFNQYNYISSIKFKLYNLEINAYFCFFYYKYPDSYYIHKRLIPSGLFQSWVNTILISFQRLFYNITWIDYSFIPLVFSHEYLLRVWNRFFFKITNLKLKKKKRKILSRFKESYAIYIFFQCYKEGAYSGLKFTKNIYSYSNSDTMLLYYFAANYKHKLTVLHTNRVEDLKEDLEVIRIRLVFRFYFLRHHSFKLRRINRIW